MRKNLTILLLPFLLSIPSLAVNESSATTQDPQLITQARQLTFVGPRSGEGYFSADGKKMIFQSERFEGNPFYQIYLMDLASGKTDLLSTGKGKTTCSWVHPSLKKVMFSSTHLDLDFDKKVKEELEQRKAPQKGRYAWSYDENFDIFETDLQGKNLKRLTKEKGYDAEGSYSPDGQWIAFASNRNGYSEKLSPEDEKIFNQDPSYMMDIYLMKADGSQVKQLTDVKGYDGGPFFSPNGRKITWRRFAPNGQSAEVYVMNLDGSEQKEITHLKAMSWAPYFHPSGDYLIFTTNILGYSNFELYIVDTEGKKDPIRVSYMDDFDGLPVFSPDGKQLAWTHKNAKGESQIYLAQWNDQKARELLGLAPKAPGLAELKPEILAGDAEAWVSYLASEKMAGRRTGSAEELQYMNKIAEYFKALGLVPLTGGDFIQSFEFTSGVELGKNNELAAKMDKTSVSFKVNEDYTPLSFSKTGSFKEASIAFAGYGIKAPASDSQAAYDSFEKLDVKDKWVLAFRDIPEGISNERRVFLNMYSRVHHKALVARQNGATGLLLVNGPNSSSKKLIKLRYEGGFAESGIPVISISNEVAEALVKKSGKTLKQLQDAVDQGQIFNTPLEGVTLSAQVDLNLQKSTGHNVLARLNIPKAQQTILLGAHGDHLGRGEMGSSLAKTDEQGLTHYGADDNASGVSGVLELAHYFASNKKNLKQNLAFAVWSGEEIGLLGSTHFIKNNKTEKFSAYLNMDMIGRLRGQLLVQGVGSAKEWVGLSEKLAAQTQMNIGLQEDPYQPTDAMAFYLQNVPSISLFTGAHGEYHSPRDRAETLNYPGLAQTVQFMKALTETLAVNAQSPLTYQKVEGNSRKHMEGRSFRIYLGTIPDYSQEGIKGVKVTGTSKSSPAEKAGVKTGDIIVELANTKIENLYDYVYCLQAMKANEPVKMKVVRAGQTLELSITPSLKE